MATASLPTTPKSSFGYGHGSLPSPFPQTEALTLFGPRSGRAVRCALHSVASLSRCSACSGRLAPLIFRRSPHFVRLTYAVLPVAALALRVRQASIAQHRSLTPPQSTALLGRSAPCARPSHVTSDRRSRYRSRRSASERHGEYTIGRERVVAPGDPRDPGKGRRSSRPDKRFPGGLKGRAGSKDGRRPSFVIPKILDFRRRGRNRVEPLGGPYPSGGPASGASGSVGRRAERVLLSEDIQPSDCERAEGFQGVAVRGVATLEETIIPRTKRWTGTLIRERTRRTGMHPSGRWST